MFARFVVDSTAQLDHLLFLGYGQDLVDEDIEYNVDLSKVPGMFDVTIAGIMQYFMFQNQLDVRYRKIEHLGIDVDEVFLFIKVIAPTGNPGLVTDLNELGYFQQVQAQPAACLDQFLVGRHQSLLS